MSLGEIIVEEREDTSTRCACCGGTTLRLTGDLKDQNGWLAFYSVRYSAAHPERLPRFVLGYGDWSSEAPPGQRWVFGADWSKDHNGFRLADLSSGPSQGDATHLDRSDILDTRFAEDAFAMLDAILMHDTRLKDLQHEH
ncbi:hypothetical protein V8J82_19015 [Gymnodinialimonas sp. 2305UL16-5]|uniref:hypothetical protein n=1 Tax=Gymnodinialimonas mytili TaxID=3126503 RepID=UPI0030B3CE40